MPRYAADCHCGAVRLCFDHPEITAGMRCDCSICARKGIVMTPEAIARGSFAITDPQDCLRSYAFGTGVAQHRFCVRCGIHLLVETRLTPGHIRVNLGCVDGVDALRLPAPIYPGRTL